MIYFTASAIAATVVAKVLKNVLRQPRPLPRNKNKAKKSYGMPSSHSTAISFFTSYLTCVVLVTPTIPYKYLLLIVFHCFSLSVIWSRVRLQHHTQSQVVAGTLLGASLAIFSFILWIIYFSTHLPMLIQNVDILKDILS
ncbi:hypothetical protein INT46_006794 [Mucor plumbeus]|uniref:Phosphatidic acid phosphatase type 2/haloperoxidase domain-containing protein n=1 Tax=Mucor plumbeus TaxID=97098 RepID=A0A8H7QFW4_9FUNG|nr:hypothetical protein INT46_006794 [Mucor plumbeus]